MLTRVAIENFKGVGDRVELELAPVTLLFGPNSSGKSTVLQALQYLHHLLARGNPSADRTPHGGDSVDLGGFASFVHRHDTERTVCVRIGFDVATSINVFAQDDVEFPFPDLDDELVDAWVEVRVRKEIGREGVDAAVTELIVGTGGSEMPIARTNRELRPEGHEELMAYVNLSHPVLRESANDEDSFDIFEQGAQDSSVKPDAWWSTPIRTNKVSALPPLDRPVSIIDDTAEDAIDANRLSRLTTLLTMLLIGVPVLLSRELEALTYVGPLRIVPGRGFVAERSPRAGRWADGSGAWDLLALGGQALRARVNKALQAIGVPYKVGQHLAAGGVMADVESNLDESAGNGWILSAVLVDEGGTHLLPSAIGVGVSQLVPVIAACVRAGGGLVAIEQPELHIHPAWQTQLGDFVIESSAKRQLLIETHSEHLILRIVRRIRETTDGELPDGAPSFSPEKLSVLHVNRAEGVVRAQRLRVDATGEFIDRWPRGFFEERAEELF